MATVNLNFGSQNTWSLPTLPESSLHFLRWGNPTDRPLLFLHGLGDCAAVWSGVATILSARGYQVIALDLPGHGDSVKGDRAYDCEAIIADLEPWLDQLGWNQITAIGHSWTGKLLARWAQQSPDRFQQLVIVDPFFIGKIPSWLQITFPVLYRTLPFLQMCGPFADRAAAETKAKTLKQYREWNALQSAVFAVNLEQKADGTWGSKLDLWARDRIFVDVLRVAGITQPIQIPTLLMLPDRGLNRFAWQVQDFYTFCQALTVESIPGNHWAFLAHAPEFAQVLDRHLKSSMGSAVIR
ncbi:MAG: alpha/beta hydrolase [Oscillatoriales cyanobacterium]|nr:MAG: alpha/beta hydrolase [Oscillatoriales cyanobacterium]